MSVEKKSKVDSELMELSRITLRLFTKTFVKKSTKSMKPRGKVNFPKWMNCTNTFMRNELCQNIVF